MKRIGLFLTSFVLLLAGCAKEQMTPSDLGEGLQTVTFTAAMADGVTTKAAADGDGEAAYVNRCIMEVYYDNTLYTRMYAKVTDKKASFTTQVVSNRTYTVAFWADHVDFPDTEAGIGTDKYYNTADGLGNVALTGTYMGNDDVRDAFAFCTKYTVGQAGNVFSAVLRRPFAQINVITTDVSSVKTVATLKPETVSVVLKNAMTEYSVLDSTAVAGQTENLTYETSLYNWDVTKSECTLSMDYVFAEKEKGVIDIDWKARKTGDTDVSHTFTSVPFQRNYRTNIKGALLTATGKWNVTVDPDWGDPEDDFPVVIASSIEDAQEAISPSDGSKPAGTVIVTPEAVTGRDQTKDKTADSITVHTPGVTLPAGSKAIEFVLTETSNTDVVFELPPLPGDDFYWYIRHEDNYPTKNLTVKVNSSDATRVIIDAPNDTHVVLNDVTYTHVVALTGNNTLVVPAGITVDKLTVKKGAVEIHGTVTALEVVPQGNDTVRFHECEGLSAGVFAVIKGQDHDYIDRPAYTEKQNGDKWDIVKASFLIIRNNEPIAGYATIAEAMAAAQPQDVIYTDLATLALPEIKKSDIALKGNGSTVITSVGGLPSTSANVVFDGFEFATQVGFSGAGFTIRNCTFSANNGLRYSYANGDQVLIENCVFNTTGYAIHFDEGDAALMVRNCRMSGFSTFGASLASVTFDHCEFVDSDINDYYVAQTRGQHIVFNQCSFSDKWCTINDKQTVGIASGTGTAELNNCTAAKGAVVEACRNSALTGLAAVDAARNQNGKYTAGTFFGCLDSLQINIAEGCQILRLGDNIYSVDKVDGVAKVGDKYYKTLDAACAAVTPDAPMAWVDPEVWAENKAAYYGGSFYNDLTSAVNAANAADSDEAAIIYLRPKFESPSVGAHDPIKTSITIYGNNAKLNKSWAPAVEFDGGDPSSHTLTKDITFAIYNLHNGAGVWGKRISDYTINAIMKNCTNAYLLLVNQNSGSDKSITNFYVDNCTFDKGQYGENCPVTTTNPGVVSIKNSSFKDMSGDYTFNINNKNGGALSVEVKNLIFDNCGSSQKAAFRLMGEAAGSTVNAILDSVSFINNTGKIGDIVVGKANADDNKAEVTYSIKNTAGKMNVYTVNTATQKAEITLQSDLTYSGDNK